VVIKLREYRALDIDLSEADGKDYLHLIMEKGTPIFLSLATSSHSCSRHWLYILENMWPIDTEQVNDIVKQEQTRDDTIDEAIVRVVTPFRIQLDRPLVCTVEAVRPDGSTFRRLGSFESGGGRVRTVYAHTLNPARA